MKLKANKLVYTGAALAFLAAAGAGFAQTPPPGPGRHTNGPPTVAVVAPQNGQTFLEGVKIVVAAGWQSFTDAVAQVEFFAGTNSLGVVTNRVPATGRHEPPQVPFASLVWSDAAAGDYALTAAATDLAGIIVTSPAVNISVVTDLPPVIRLVAPRNGTTILGPANITLTASAHDPDPNGSVANVAFFAGTNLLGVVTNPPPIWVTNFWGVFPLVQTSYSLTWSNAAAGPYTLTAVATDADGLTAASTPVSIVVVTDLPPVVQIVRPENHSAFYAPANITITAAARDPDTALAGVEFFAGTQSLGVATNPVPVTNFLGQVETDYSLTWSNVAAAAYLLTAVATDNHALSATSAPVHVTVVAPPAPTVAIIDPPNGAQFIAPANIYIATVARHFPDPVATVQFLAGTNVLGVVTNSFWPTFAWKAVPAGAYSLTAVATDTAGHAATSPAVSITVSTNRPPGRRH